jgi:hypothetical protein
LLGKALEVDHAVGHVEQKSCNGSKIFRLTYLAPKLFLYGVLQLQGLVGNGMQLIQGEVKLDSQVSYHLGGFLH